MAIVLGLVSAGCSPHWRTPADLPGSPPAPAVLHDLPPQIRSFIEQQRQLALVLAEKLGVKPDAATLEYFRLAGKGEYRAASLIYLDLRQRGGKDDSPRYDPNLRLPLWDPLLEVQLTLDAYAAGAGKFATAFGRSVVRSIPPGSVYFGGTDTGRGLAAAFSEPDFEGNDLFILTQNQLVDRQHSDYLRARFGDKIYIHSHDDATRVFIGYFGGREEAAGARPEFPG
jgi:hypothetical protein